MTDKPGGKVIEKQAFIETLVDRHILSDHSIAFITRYTETITTIGDIIGTNASIRVVGYNGWSVEIELVEVENKRCVMTFVVRGLNAIDYSNQLDFDKLLSVAYTFMGDIQLAIDSDMLPKH